jgi:protein-L-isoaspartate(D-aspartate) O-methyltransferase
MASSQPSAGNDPYASFKLQMVATIERSVQETASYIGKSALDKRVMSAMASVPRHEFVPSVIKPLAYNDCALKIGLDQTISQPYIVALMTDLIAPQPDHIVLEIGTGSGYQSAVLSCLVNHVYSIEVITELADNAGERLQHLGFNNVSVRNSNGREGWPEKSPFDAIVVTAAGDLPHRLLNQLKPGGRMVIPIGDQHSTQYLTQLEKDLQGNIHKQKILPVRFVPLVGA